MEKSNTVQEHLKTVMFMKVNLLIIKCRVRELENSKVENGKLNGLAEYTSPDGSAFEGLYENGKISRGKFIHSDGVVREGEWKGGKLHGIGKEILKNGVISEGVFHNGIRHGKFKIIFPSGKTCSGDFVNDNPVAGKWLIKLLAYRFTESFRKKRK